MTGVKDSVTCFRVILTFFKLFKLLLSRKNQGNGAFL